MIKLSVVIISYNEEHNIGRCIDSVKDIADDIVVLDSFSKDKTQQISESKGARFFQHVFDGHIEQKNRIITHAKYPHILSIDADEALDETLKKSILEVKNNWTHDGYTMNRLTNYCGKWIKHCGWYPDTKLRLWDSRKGAWTGINPHDEYKMLNNEVTKHLKGDILHYSYYSISQHIQQVDYFTTISSKAFYNKGKKASVLKMIFSAKLKFIRDYFIKLGFLDGYYGFVICAISAFATFTKYLKIRELWKKKRQETR